MTVHFIGAGPGAPDLITVRGRDLVARCPVCLYAGSLVPREIVAFAPAGARIVDTAPLTLDEIVAEIEAADAAGLDVARLQSGDLSIWSALGEQIRRLDALGIPYTVTPGVPGLRCRGGRAPARADPARGRRSPSSSPAPPGAPPRCRRRETLDAFGATGATLAVHLSIHALGRVVAEASPHYGADCPVAVVYRASWPDERIVRGTLADIEAKVAAAPIERTALILDRTRRSTRPVFAKARSTIPDYRRRYRGGEGS